jgi:hypothetical protein
MKVIILIKTFNKEDLFQMMNNKWHSNNLYSNQISILK